MNKQSAGILVFRIVKNRLPEILLVHPGGPFYGGKDLGVWSVPKGEYDNNETPLAVAKREFYEETGNKITSENFIELNPVRTKSGKTVHVWAVEENFDDPYLSSNTFELEWPSGSGKFKLFPECDKAEWFNFDEAAKMIFAYQKPLIEQLQKIIKKIPDMSNEFFNVMIDDRVTSLEKARIVSIEPYEYGTKITIEASHTEEEPIIYFTPEEYEKVMASYLG